MLLTTCVKGSGLYLVRSVFLMIEHRCCCVESHRADHLLQLVLFYLVDLQLLE